MRFRAAAYSDRRGHVRQAGQPRRASAATLVAARRHPPGHRQGLRRVGQPAEGRRSSCSTRPAPTRAGRPPGRCRLRRPLGGREALPAQPVPAVHDVDPPAGGRPQAALHRPAHHVDGPAAVRERLHHLHAHRQHVAVGDGGDRRPAPGGASCTGPTYVPETPRRYEKKVKNAQEAHEAIRPAGESFRTPDQVSGELAADERALYDLDLEAHRRLPDGRRPGQERPGPPRRRRRRPARTRCSRPAAARIEFPGFLRAYVEGSDDPDAVLEDREVRLPVLAAGDALAVEALRGQGPRHQPAGPLHRGVAGQGPGGDGRGPPVDLRVDHRHHPGPGLRLAQGHRPGADVDRLRRRHPAGAPLRRPRRLRLHRPDGGRPRQHRPGRREAGRRGCRKFYFGNGDARASSRW